MGSRRYYITAIIDVNDKYDFESAHHFSSHSEIRDADSDAWSVIMNQIPCCETICALTKIDDGVKLRPIKSDIAPLGRHLINVKDYYKTLKTRWSNFKEGPPVSQL